MPSVRGRTRLTVAAGLIAAATAAGALSGLIAFVFGAPLRLLTGSSPDMTTPLVVALVGSGAILDGLHLRTGRPSPPAVGRQVPREWTRLLDPRIVAVLFGARLGVGPLTILSTWGWWSATIASSVLGPAPAVLVGATFGFARLVVAVCVSILVDHRDQAAWFIRFRSGRKTGWATLNGAGLLAAFSLVVAGCAPSADRPQFADEPVSPAVLAAGSAGDLGVTADSPLPPTPPSTVPADLEDFVRAPAPPSTPSAAPSHRRASPPSASAEGEAVTRPAPTRAGTASPEGTSGIATGESSGEPSALAAALPDGIDGFEAIAGPEADRYLDLRAAADIQPDPTEEIALLETRGFRGGWTRAFRSETNDVAVVSVYEFESPAQAEFYLEDGLITIGGYGGSFFDIEGLPGVRGFAQAFTDGDEELVSLGASFQAGPRWFLVYLVGSPETVTPETLIPVIAEQQGRHVAATSAG